MITPKGQIFFEKKLGGGKMREQEIDYAAYECDNCKDDGGCLLRNTESNGLALNSKRKCEENITMGIMCHSYSPSKRNYAP